MPMRLGSCSENSDAAAREMLSLSPVSSPILVYPPAPDTGRLNVQALRIHLSIRQTYINNNTDVDHTGTSSIVGDRPPEPGFPRCYRMRRRAGTAWRFDKDSRQYETDERLDGDGREEDRGHTKGWMDMNKESEKKLW